MNLNKNYKIMFKKYPDVVDIEQMRKMLGGISSNLAYKLIKEEKIKCIKVGRQYKIPKNNIINYITNEI